MKVMTLVEAIDGIDDDLVYGAIVYQPKKGIRWMQIKWTRWGAIAACLCLAIVGVFIIPVIQSPAGQGFFNATVKEIYEDYIVAECYESILGDVPVGKKIQVSTNNISGQQIPEMKNGDSIRILYIGRISEAENGLLVLEKTVSIFLIDGNGEVIVE